MVLAKFAVIKSLKWFIIEGTAILAIRRANCKYVIGGKEMKYQWLMYINLRHNALLKYCIKDIKKFY